MPRVLVRLVLVGLLFSTISATAGEHQPGKASLPSGLVLELKTPWSKTLYLPISASAPRFAILPLRDSEAVAVKVTPKLLKGGLEVELSALLGEPGLSCEEIRQLPAQLIGTYKVGLGEKVVAGPFKELMSGRVQMKLSRVSAKVITAEGEYLTAAPPPGCCGCGSLNCCPNAGQCLDCGGCGRCCAAAQT